MACSRLESPVLHKLYVEHLATLQHLIMDSFTHISMSSEPSASGPVENENPGDGWSNTYCVIA